MEYSIGKIQWIISDLVFQQRRNKVIINEYIIISIWIVYTTIKMGVYERWIEWKKYHVQSQYKASECASIDHQNELINIFYHHIRRSTRNKKHFITCAGKLMLDSEFKQPKCSSIVEVHRYKKN